MPAAKQAPAAKRTAKARADRGTAALDGLEVSLEQAQQAITDLRRDLSTGGRQLVKDVETAVKSARRDLRKTRWAIQGDLGDLGEALTPRRPARKAAAPAPKAKPKARQTTRARSA